LAVKGRIVTREAVNTHALMERSLTENEIPGGVGIKIVHGDREQTKGVRGQAGLQKPENIDREDLAVFRVWVQARREVGARSCGQGLHFHLEIRGGKAPQFVQRRALTGREFPEGQQVNHAANRVRLSWAGALEVQKSLRLF